MPASIPDAKHLLKVVIKYLEQELMPTLEGYHRFQTRVSANVLSTVRRELELGQKQAAEERARLRAILGHDGEVEDLSRELADRIRAGTISIEDRAVHEHVRESLAEALRINNPKWLTR